MAEIKKINGMNIKDETARNAIEALEQIIEEVVNNLPEGGSSEHQYEIQKKTLTFDNGNIIHLSEDVQDCTCNVNYIIDTSSFNIPTFTNLIPFNPLSSAENSVTNGIQRYKGTLEFIDDNIVKFTANDETTLGIFKSMSSPSTVEANHKYLYRSYMSDDGIAWTVHINKVVVADSSGVIASSDMVLWNITQIAMGVSKYIKNPLIIDLTAMYGEGNEPTNTEMLNIIPEDVWNNETYSSEGESNEFVIISKNIDGVVVDTYVSDSNDKTLDIVSGGTIEADGNQPNNTTFTNVLTKVLVENNLSNVANTKNIINLHNVDRLLFIGDSYTEGIYYQKGKAWVCQMSEQLDYTCEGYGWGGYTCRTIAENIQNNLTRYNSIPVKNLNATRAMLMSFVNDMSKGGTDSSVFQSNMEELIKTVYDMGCKPIVCTEFRKVWDAGLQIGLKALAQQYNCDFWNILAYTSFLGTKTASDDEAQSQFYNGSHPAQRTGGIIFNNYLKFAQNLPRPASAIKIYRLRDGIEVSNVNDLYFDNRRDKLLKFKEIKISHSCLSNPDDWDNVTTPVGTIQNGVNSEYGKLMNNETVDLGEYTLVECVLPTLKGNIKSLKLCLSDSNVEIYAKKLNEFISVNDRITDFTEVLEYDKITFLLYKNNGLSLNDIYIEWEGDVVEKHDVIRNSVLRKGTELLTKTTVDDISWLTTEGTVEISDPTNYTCMPTGCTKLITIDNANYVSFNVDKPTQVVGTTTEAKVRVVCRYNPPQGSSEITVNSYDRKVLELRIKGQNMTNIPTSYYSIKHEVDMSWTMCEFDIELNESSTLYLVSNDETQLEICYISVLEL